MPTKFTFLLIPQVHILDLAGPDQAIHEAIDYRADFEIEYCSTNNPISTSSGLPFSKVKHFSKTRMKKGDFIIVPGATHAYLVSPEFIKQKDLFSWLRLNYANGVNICSVCLGAFVLAESGLLNGIPCTTHFKKTKDLQLRYPAILVNENILFTDQNRLYTSAGIASGIDLILHIIEKLKCIYFSHLVARELVVYNRRNGNATQESELMKFRNHIHSGIHLAQDFIIENINKKRTLSQLAEIANMSERNFTRIFKKETGITVNEFITTIRKEKIKELLKHPDHSILSIANKVGLKSEKQVKRILSTK